MGKDYKGQFTDGSNGNVERHSTSGKTIKTIRYHLSDTDQNGKNEKGDNVMS